MHEKLKHTLTNVSDWESYLNPSQSDVTQVHRFFLMFNISFISNVVIFVV